MKRKIHALARRATKFKQPATAPPLERITNETVAEHREAVLGRARKYVYPLSHSRHRIVMISVWIFVLAVIGFFAWTTFAIYKLQSTSSFIYTVSSVVPFPVAKAGPNFVSYEDYLFELRHYMHYYQTQQQVNFSSKAGQQQLKSFKKQALQEVIDNAYVKQLASAHHISVSNQEVSNEVALVRSQNRLGSSNEVFRNVLAEFWGWSVSDFRRELKQQLLTQKVVATLDTGTQERANQALAKLNQGVDFKQLASQVSDDVATRASGGEYGSLIDKSNRDIAPQVAAALFKLQPNQHSGIINTGYSLEIVEVISRQGDKVQAEHMSFNFQDINTYIAPLEAHHPVHHYIKV